MYYLRILVVDDEVDFLDTLMNRLQLRQIKATGVASGEKALEIMRQKRFDAVILDVKMPGGMDGIETLRAMKKIQPLTEIILLTGYASKETSVEGMELGAFDYVLKPIKLDELLIKIGEALEAKSAHDDKLRKGDIKKLIRFPDNIYTQGKDEQE
ncbi:response regulator [Desulfococcaceae bacterium HSG9]|nr:response regulator [Desulfococcaceae bacterium HSG9]